MKHQDATAFIVVVSFCLVLVVKTNVVARALHAYDTTVKSVSSNDDLSLVLTLPEEEEASYVRFFIFGVALLLFFMID